MRFALTGTPIENSLNELLNIFEFLMPNYLIKPKSKKLIENEEIQQIKKQVTPFILRRQKIDVLKELPEKVENTLFAVLDKEQEKLYAYYLALTKNEIEINIKEKGFEKSRIQILAAITRLRQICNHPKLIAKDYNGASGKFDLLLERIEEMQGQGHRLLLFSQFTSMLTILREVLDAKNIQYYYLDGKTKSEDRVRLTERFNKRTEPIDLFLISLKAGGTGLNLTGADVVIHFDQWYNPAVMDQATDRAHRMGQKKVVQVFNLITKNTIEERILKLHAKKRQLVDEIITDETKILSAMTKEELLSIFS